MTKIKNLTLERKLREALRMQKESATLFWDPSVRRAVMDARARVVRRVRDELKEFERQQEDEA